MPPLLHLLAGKIKLRRCQQQEHEDGDAMAIGKAAHNLRAKLKEPRAENVIAELLVFEQGDHDAEQPKDAAPGDQAAGVERTGTDVASGGGSAAAFYEPAHRAAGKNSHRRSDGKVCAGGEGQRANAE